MAQALSLLLETYRTEDKGVLYEHVSNNLKVDSLRRQLRELVESLRHPEESTEKRLLLRDAIDALELIHDWVTSHMKDRLASMSFIDFLARNFLGPARGKIPGLRSSFRAVDPRRLRVLLFNPSLSGHGTGQV